ncbi:MAG: hypothetical protein AABX05_01300 [Nanoarchaeota archaeon]
MNNHIGNGIYLSDPDDPFFKFLVKIDLAKSKEDSRLALDDSLHDTLLVQTVLGHAQSGHKIFFEADAKFPYANITDIIKAAGLSVTGIKSTRQQLIDEVFEWVELAKKDQTDRLVINERPLLGVEFLRGYKVDPEYVLKGMIMAGLMDNYEWRKATVAKYGKTINNQPLVIGGGETHLVDSEKLQNEYVFLLKDLEEGEADEEKINELRAKGIITNKENPNAAVAYIRRKKGLGTSDDTAFIMMGEMYKKQGWVKALSAFLGGFVVDGIDTYDKCVLRPVQGGYDEKLGLEIKTALPSLVSDDDVTALIYYSAKGNGKRIVSSSHKRLIQIIQNVDPKLPTLLHHHKFLDTGKHARFTVGFEKLRSSDFYTAVTERLEHYREHK